MIKGEVSWLESQRKEGYVIKDKKKNTGQSFVGDEILIWASLAVSLLLLISNFGMGGFLGDGVAAFLSAAFGWVAYAVPFLLFGTIAFTVSNRGNANAYLKTGAILVLAVLACTLFQLVDDAGGFVGSLLAGLLVPAIGTRRYISWWWSSWPSSVWYLSRENPF